MNKVKITVIETDYKEELIKQYGSPLLEVCHRHKVGDTYITAFQKPEQLCEDAWCCIEKFVFTLAHTDEPLFWNDWSKQGTAIVCCNDGFRPVTFKIERLDEQA